MESLESAVCYLSDNLGSLTFRWSGSYDKVLEISTVGQLENMVYRTMYRCPAGMETESVVGAVEDHRQRVLDTTCEV